MHIQNIKKVISCLFDKFHPISPQRHNIMRATIQNGDSPLIWAHVAIGYNRTKQMCDCHRSENTNDPCEHTSRLRRSVYVSHSDLSQCGLFDIHAYILCAQKDVRLSCVFRRIQFVNAPHIHHAACCIRKMQYGIRKFIVFGQTSSIICKICKIRYGSIANQNLAQN